MEPLGQVAGYRARLEGRITAPFRRTGPAFWAWVACLLAVIAWGGVAYSFQWRDGLYVTGMRDRIFWGLYVTLFVYFIGASMAGTFVSAILRIAQAEWRLSIIRGAEMMTVAALFTAAMFVMMDIGRPERTPNILLFGRWESPLVWDMYGLATYMAGSILYLYLAMVPDLALVRDWLAGAAAPPRRLLLRLTAIGWFGDPGQVRILAGVLTVMTIVMIPVAVMMHTVTSWVFAMTLREPWDSSMFGIYFVGGAVYSGVGLIVILMVVMRRVYRLEEYITARHFRYLGYMLASFATIMVFFNVSEFVTLGYKTAHEGPFNLHQMTHGALAPVFWTYIWGGLGLPILLILLPATRTIPGIVLAAIFANVGMFLERYFIVVGGLRVPLNPYDPAHYTPTWVEWSLMAAGFAIFALIVTLLLKLFPALAISEMLEVREHRLAAVEPAAEGAGA
ncbi:MAG: NrfD/PsrC family molybdoenzyme membrane anchor subunit [Dehalococcoidia bacterium]